MQLTTLQRFLKRIEIEILDFIAAENPPNGKPAETEIAEQLMEELRLFVFNYN